MDKLSLELVEAIAGHLDVVSALALAATCRAMYAACRNRLDPVAYLQTTFNNPRSLLAAMTDHGCILSGSRALEFFVPGCLKRDAPSDWDFLVPCTRDSAMGMMAALAAAGVRWTHPLQSLLDLDDQPPGTIAHVQVAAVGRLTTTRLAGDPCVPVTPWILGVFKRLRTACQSSDDPATDWFAIRVGTNPAALPHITIVPWTAVRGVPGGPPEAAGDSSDPPDDDEDGQLDYAGSAGRNWPVRLINGTVGHGAGATKVQLFQCHAQHGQACTPLQYVFDTYYATHVQCFLAGWGAGHAFFDLARARLALLWPAGATDVPVVGPAAAAAADAADTAAATNTNRARGVAKYRARGMRVFDVDAPMREIGDDLAPLSDAALAAAPPLSQDQWLALLDASRALLAAANGPFRPTAADPVAIRLGQPGTGTLLLRFGALQHHVCAAADTLHAGHAARALYAALGRSLAADFRFALLRRSSRAGRRPAALEPATPDLPRRPPGWPKAVDGEDDSGAAAAAAAAADNDNDADAIAANHWLLGLLPSLRPPDSSANPDGLPPLATVLVRGVPPLAAGGAAGIDRTQPRPLAERVRAHAHHTVLLRATPGACKHAQFCERNLKGRGPPQV